MDFLRVIYIKKSQFMGLQILQLYSTYPTNHVPMSLVCNWTEVRVVQ